MNAFPISTPDVVDAHSAPQLFVPLPSEAAFTYVMFPVNHVIICLAALVIGGFIVNHLANTLPQSGKAGGCEMTFSRPQYSLIPVTSEANLSNEQLTEQGL